MITRNEISQGCFNLLVRRMGREVTRAYDRAFAKIGLTSGQFTVLAMLSEEPVPGMGEISERMALDRTTLVAALKPLERRGLIMSGVDPKDRRRRPLVLTPEGMDLFQQALPVWSQAQADLEDRFGAERLRGLREILAP